jgi:DNA-binding NtrC family response regulator
MRKRLLLVDPSVERLAVLQQALRFIADVEACSEFAVGRKRLFAHPPDLLVSSVRLQAYNGLHLMYLAAVSGLYTRAIVYDDARDVVLLREAQAAGAFVESPQRLYDALPAYLLSTSHHAIDAIP